MEKCFRNCYIRRLLLLAAMAVYFSLAFYLMRRTGIGCIFLYLWKIPCPGCGMTRAAWLLMHGQPLASLKQNPFLFVIFIAAYMGFAEISPHMIGKQLPQISFPNWMLIALCVIVLLHTIVRNVLKFI